MAVLRDFIPSRHSVYVLVWVTNAEWVIGVERHVALGGENSISTYSEPLRCASHIA